MDVLKTAHDIEDVIEAIKIEGKLSKGLYNEMAKAMRDYDRDMGVAVAQLKSQGNPITLIPVQAKAVCAEALMNKVIAESAYKSHRDRLRYLEVQQSGFQTIFKHLDNTGR